MTEEPILLEKAGKRITWLILNRPKVLNCINLSMLRKFYRIIGELRDDDDTRVIIFRGRGRAFSTGNDLKQQMTPDEVREFQELGREMCYAIHTLPQVTIAAISGFCLAGGLEIAISCDFRVATPQSMFGLPEIGINIVPIWAGVNLLPKVFGLHAAKEIAFGAERFDIEQALKYGLITKVIESGDFEGEVIEFAKRFTKKDPHLIRLAKLSMINSLEVPLGENFPFLNRVFDAYVAPDRAAAFKKLYIEVVKKD